MKDLPAKRRAALKAFIDSYGKRKRNWVAIKAGVAESALRAFLAGKTAYLEEPTYDRLAFWSGWTVPELKGEEPAPSSDDIVSRKSGTERERGNDFLNGAGKTHNQTVGSLESEGEVPDRLFMEILDKIEALPPGHLHRLRLLIDRLDGTGPAQSDPRKAGVAE